MTTRTSTKAVLSDRNLAPKRRFGQNFLVNQNTIKAIINRASPGKEDTIVEFGVGLGAMTIPMAEKVKRIIGIEIDSGLVKMHRETCDLPENVTLIHDDLLKHDFNSLAEQCGGKLKIIANLPYSISNPLIFKLIEHHRVMDYAVLMLQKEVADRLAAIPKTKEYGVLSVLLPIYAKITKLMKIGPEQFHPRPKVDSVVVKIDFNKHVKELQDTSFEYTLLKSIVKGAFQQRRKTLINSLNATGIYNFNKEQIMEVLTLADIKPTIRADQLSNIDYIAISLAYQKINTR